MRGHGWIIGLLWMLSACSPAPSGSTAFNIDAREFNPPTLDGAVGGRDDGGVEGRRVEFSFPFLNGEDATLLKIGIMKLSACGLPMTLARELEALLFVEALRERLIFIETTRATGPSSSTSSRYPLLAAEEDLRCVFEAGRCDEVLACVGLIESAPCDPSVFEDYCGEGKAVLCGRLQDLTASTLEPERYITVVRDCARQVDGNTTCHEAPDVDFRRVDCVYDVAPCDETYPRCEGDAVLHCEAGRVFKRDCGRLGGVCVEGACDYPPEHHCAQYHGSLQRCEAGQLEDCSGFAPMELHTARDRGGFVGTRDCAALSLSCEGAKDCAMQPPECEMIDDQCQGAIAEVCVKGRAYQVSCALIGARCESGGGALRCELSTL